MHYVYVFHVCKNAKNSIGDSISFIIPKTYQNGASHL